MAKQRIKCTKGKKHASGHKLEHGVEEIIIQGSQLGDINNDTTINILDVVLIVNFIIGSTNPSNQEFYAADVNQDSLLNILDVVLLVNMILGSEDIDYSSADINSDGDVNVIDVVTLVNLILG